tara:strand:+ start:609 stop:1073 length:465 start_codon:yes stop_codon:yes gene_type:complete
MKNILLLLSVIILFSCNKDEVALLDETLLLGRWEPYSKHIVYKDGRDVFTNEDICEWYDTYTFYENGRLRYADGIKIAEGQCGDNPELEIEGEWNQDSNGKFSFTITKTDGSQLILNPKDFYFFQEEPFLRIEYFEEDPNSEVEFYYTNYSILK